MTPVDAQNRTHNCQDTQGLAFGGRWYCKCWGGPYFTHELLRLAYVAEQAAKKCRS